jgi:hypothetical protein
MQQITLAVGTLRQVIHEKERATAGSGTRVVCAMGDPIRTLSVRARARAHAYLERSLEPVVLLLKSLDAKRGFFELAVGRFSISAIRTTANLCRRCVGQGREDTTHTHTHARYRGEPIFLL